MNDYTELKNKVSDYIRNQFFNFNEETTRRGVKCQTEDDLKRNFPDMNYLVVCDKTNNTPEIVDANGFNLDIYIKENDKFRILKFYVFESEVKCDDVITE